MITPSGRKVTKAEREEREKKDQDVNKQKTQFLKKNNFPKILINQS
jgi:hypothetical protein